MSANALGGQGSGVGTQALSVWPAFRFKLSADHVQSPPTSTMNRQAKWATLVAVAAVIAGPLVVVQTGYVAFNQWRPVVRDGSYRALLREFNEASPIPQRPIGDGSTGWDFEVPLPNDVRVSVRARSHMAVVTAKYSDEGQERELYRYKDYSSPISLKTHGPVLYVYWAETLFGSDHWVLAYDLATRSELSRERVVPGDLRSANDP